MNPTFAYPLEWNALKKAASMSQDANGLLIANLSLLPPATRWALERADTEMVRRSDDGRSAIRTSDGRWVALHSAADPIKACDGIVERWSSDRKPAAVIVIGLGLGYLLEALERRNSPINVLALEPIPAVARAMLARRDWSQWIESGKLKMLVGPDYAGAFEAWRLFGNDGTTPPSIISPVLEREFTADARRATEVAEQIVGGVKANAEARRRFAGRYLLNTLTNLPVIAREGNAAALFNTFNGLPAFVVGAGPSLDRNLSGLAAVNSRVLIIAVDTAVRPLLAAGIPPHVAVAVDPSDLNAQHLRDLPDTRGVWLVAEASVDPTVFPQFARRTFTFRVSNHHPWPWLDEHGLGRGQLQAWGSVLTTAFDLACKAGCNPIVFAGADLAYTGGLLYCRNTVYEPEWSHLATDAERAREFEPYFAKRPTCMQPDVRGAEVLSTPLFVQFRDWIVARCESAERQIIVNATGGGILRGGRIVQQGLPDLVLPQQPHDAEIENRLAVAWAVDVKTRSAARERIQLALVRGRASAPTELWREFAGNQVSSTEIEAQLEHASQAIGVLT